MQTQIQPRTRIGIKIEVCPEKCTGINLHSHNIIDELLWSKISHLIRSRQRGICQCCGVTPHGGATAEMSTLVAHEVWYFDKENHVQKLIDIVCICKRCHLTIHYANLLRNKNINERESFISKAHYMEVNHCSEIDFERELNEALALYRELNLIEEWTLDISYVLEQGYIGYEDIRFENLEKFTPGASELLKFYKKKPQIFFNKLPVKCLVDYAEQVYCYERPEPCEICEKPFKVLHQYYDLQLKGNTKELFLAGKKKICPMCRETIYFGARKWFKKDRKTTKHYMEVNQCSYEWFKQYVKDAKRTIRRRRHGVYLYCKFPSNLNDREFRKTTKYLRQHGAKFKGDVKKWYVYPRRRMHLQEFKPYL